MRTKQILNCSGTKHVYQYLRGIKWFINLSTLIDVATLINLLDKLLQAGKFIGKGDKDPGYLFVLTKNNVILRFSCWRIIRTFLKEIFDKAQFVR